MDDKDDSLIGPLLPLSAIFPPLIIILVLGWFVGMIFSLFTGDSTPTYTKREAQPVQPRPKSVRQVEIYFQNGQWHIWSPPVINTDFEDSFMSYLIQVVIGCANAALIAALVMITRDYGFWPPVNGIQLTQGLFMVGIVAQLFILAMYMVPEGGMKSAFGLLVGAIEIALITTVAFFYLSSLPEYLRTQGLPPFHVHSFKALWEGIGGQITLTFAIIGGCYRALVLISSLRDSIDAKKQAAARAKKRLPFLQTYTMVDEKLPPPPTGHTVSKAGKYISPDSLVYL